MDPKLLSGSLHPILYLEAFNNHNLTLPARLPPMKPHALNDVQTLNKANLIPTDPKIRKSNMPNTTLELAQFYTSIPPKQNKKKQHAQYYFRIG